MQEGISRLPFQRRLVRNSFNRTHSKAVFIPILAEFLFLKPGEEETWRGSVDGTPVKLGKYQAVGAYVSDYGQVHELVGLQETKDLLIADVVWSTPLPITIE